jgi:hypothetical protein
MSNKAKKPSQKLSDSSYRGARLNVPQRTAMRKAAQEVTVRYPLRFWAAWTTRTFGWWSLVCAGKWAEIAPRKRDLDEVRWALKRARDESRMRGEIAEALDEVRRREVALVEAIDDAARVALVMGRG